MACSARRPGRPSLAEPYARRGACRLRRIWLPAAAALLGRVAAQSEQDDALSSLTSFSYGYLADDRAEFCRAAYTIPPQLDAEAVYKPVSPESQEGNDMRIFLAQWRGDNLLVPLVQQCPLVATSEDSSGNCAEELSTYASSLIIYATPIILGLVFMFIWHLCCWVACCRCCRRCCLCAERKAPRPAKVWQRLVGFLIVLLSTGAISISAWLAYSRSSSVNVGVSDMLCGLSTLTDEAINGATNPTFLGVDVGIHRLQMVRKLLDVDGKAMMDVRALIDKTAGFTEAMDDLLAKISHMQRVLTLVGQRNIKEHTCVFCELANGNNATGEKGMLRELTSELAASSADAMRAIQAAAVSSLTAKSLADTSSAVLEGGNSLQNFRNGFIGVFVEMAVSQFRLVASYEDIRHTIFTVMFGFCVVHCTIISGISLWHASRSRAKYPSALLPFLSWFFGFCNASLAFIFAGGLLVLAVPVSEMCSFWREDLLTQEGVADYYSQLGLVDPTTPNLYRDDRAVEVFRMCLTGNGTGNVLGALQLEDRLYFQQQIDDRFVQLDQVMGRVMDTAKFDLLVSRARLFAGLFILNPEDKLPLEPSAAPKLFGSSLAPDDQEGPDGETLIFGLNSYASLIAGPGQYSFAHGTSGGGTLITADSPTEAETQSLPLQMRHALSYARLKEQLLSEPYILRCDALGANGRVTEIPCSHEQFKQTVIQWAEQVQEAGLRLDVESKMAYPLIDKDMRLSLRALLLEVRELRTRFRGRFAWKRWEDLDFHLCNVALPGLLEGGALLIILGISITALLVVHYKIWRHLLDNRIVGEELERYAKKYGYLQATKT